MEKDTIGNTEWFCTDSSLETLQFAQRVNKTTYRIAELGGQYEWYSDAIADIENWESNEINLKDFILLEINDFIGSFGYSLEDYDESKDIYKISEDEIIYSVSDSILLICECISESIYL